VKTLIAQEQRMLLTSRKLVQRKLMDIESDMRGTLRNFGLKVGAVSSIRYEARIRDLVEGFPRLAAIIMLRAMLYEAAQSMLTHSKKMVMAEGLGHAGCSAARDGPCLVAVARRLAVILHRMWVDGTDFRWRNGSTAVVQVA
jgi:hypothetical protein